MNRNKARPSLSSVLGGVSAAAQPVAPLAEKPQTPVPRLESRLPSLESPVPSPESSVPSPDSPRPRAGGRVQLNVLVSPELRRAVRMRALEQEEDVSDLVARALTDWLERSKLPL